MSDRFPGWADSGVTPARSAAAVTPSDVSDLTVAAKALWVGLAGTIAVIAVADTDPVTYEVPGGCVLPVRAKRVMVTGTTAGNIVALY